MSDTEREDLKKLSKSLRTIISLTSKQFPEVETITTQEFENILSKESLLEPNSNVNESNSDILVVDIRERAEFDVSHLLCANWVDFNKPYREQCDCVIDLIQEKIEEREKRDKELDVFVYCAVGIRASILVSITQRRLKRMKEKEGSPVDPEEFLTDNTEKLPYSSIILRNVEGSIYKWAHEHRPLVDKDNQKTTLVHCCSTLWGKLFVNKELRHPGPYSLIF
ncbi:uncharacterized protein LOC120337909 [Styela clava]